MSSFSQSQIGKLKNVWKSKETTSSSSTSEQFKFTKRVKSEEMKSGKTKRKRTNCNVNVTDLSSSIAEESMKRLAMTQFRHINQYLYTNDSHHALGYMDEEKFNEYHEAYSQIASVWPIKPIDVIIDKIKSMKRKKLVVADIGCGSFPLIAEKVKDATVHSFDLVSLDERVVVANATNIPLRDESVDVVVYSLSLMATDINLQIAEGCRLLKKGGSMFIAEVTSRLDHEKETANDDTNAKNNNANNNNAKDQSSNKAASSGSDLGLKQFLKQLATYYSLHKSKVEQLAPNNYFTLIHLIKKGDIKKNLPQIHLKPCIYKPR